MLNAASDPLTKKNHIDGTVPSEEFYKHFWGHKVKHLEQLLPVLRESSDRIIWTAGDSSLDNKYWVQVTGAAIENGYHKVLTDPPEMKKDVTYWLNYHAKNYDGTGAVADARRRTAAINTAVEATTLNERTFLLRPQDRFLRDNIQDNDVLLISVGANDIAMCPMPCTVMSMATLMCLPQHILEKGFTYGVMPCDDFCCGCCTSTLSCLCTCPPCMGYFRHTFNVRLEHYIRGTYICCCCRIQACIELVLFGSVLK